MLPMDDQRLCDVGRYDPDNISPMQQVFKTRIKGLQNVALSRGISPSHALLYINRRDGYRWDTIPWGKFEKLESDLMLAKYPEKTIWPDEHARLVYLLAAARTKGKVVDVPSGVNPLDIDQAMKDYPYDDLMAAECPVTAGEIGALYRKTIERAEQI